MWGEKIRSADFHVFVVRCKGGGVQDAFGRAELTVSVGQACTQLACRRLVTVLAVIY
jgi:3,4-dihydroxy-2-butanone 4-phosphate synthase